MSALATSVGRQGPPRALIVADDGLEENPAGQMGTRSAYLAMELVEGEDLHRADDALFVARFPARPRFAERSASRKRLESAADARYRGTGLARPSSITSPHSNGCRRPRRRSRTTGHETPQVTLSFSELKYLFECSDHSRCGSYTDSTPRSTRRSATARGWQDALSEIHQRALESMAVFLKTALVVAGNPANWDCLIAIKIRRISPQFECSDHSTTTTQHSIGQRPAVFHRGISDSVPYRPVRYTNGYTRGRSCCGPSFGLHAAKHCGVTVSP